MADAPWSSDRRPGGIDVAGWFLAAGTVAGQAGDVSPFSLSLVLLVGSERIPVDAELGEPTPAGVPQWGGLLRGVPERLAAVMEPGRQARLCWPDGQERSVRLGGQPQMDAQGRLIVAFLGEEPPRPGEEWREPGLVPRPHSP